MNRVEEGLPVRGSNGTARAIGQPVDGGRQLPHSVEAEQGVLSSMLIGGPEVIEEVLARIGDDVFYVPAHGTLFVTMRSLHGCGQAIDLITYTQQLRDAGLLDAVGGPSFVTSLFTLLPTAANVEYYLNIVRDKFLLRQMIATCVLAVRRAYDEQDEVRDALDQLQGNVIELTNLSISKDPLQHISLFVAEAKAEIIAAYHNRGEVTGLPTGFVDFDRMTNGLEKGFVYVFGARPAMGKTSWGLGLAEFIAVENAINGNAVQFFSMEMTGVQVTKRLISAAASVSVANMRYGFLEKDDLPKVEAAAARLIKSHVIIDESAGLNVFELRARSRRAVIKRKARLIVIDQLSFIHGVSRRARENRQLEVSEVMNAVAETAKELKVPIVVLAQLNRDPEDRKWGIPQLSDLRESGDIENYAHLVGLLWRPEYYAPTDSQKEALCKYLGKALADGSDRDIATGEVPDDFVAPIDRLEGYAQIIIAKQREGATGPCPLRFVKEYARFESMTKKLFSNNQEERQHA